MDSRDVTSQLPNYTLEDTSQVIQHQDDEALTEYTKQLLDNNNNDAAHVYRIQEKVMPMQEGVTSLDGNQTLHSQRVKERDVMRDEKQDTMSILPEDDDHHDQEQNQGDSCTLKTVKREAPSNTTDGKTEDHRVDDDDEDYHGSSSSIERKRKESFSLPHSHEDQEDDDSEHHHHKRIKRSESSEEQRQELRHFHSCSSTPETRSPTVIHVEGNKSFPQQVSLQTRTETNNNFDTSRIETNRRPLSPKMSSESPTVIVMSGSVDLPSTLSKKFIPSLQHNIPSCLLRKGELSSSSSSRANSSKMTHLMTEEDEEYRDKTKESREQEILTKTSQISSEDVTVSSSSSSSFLLLPLLPTSSSSSPSYASSVPSSSSSSGMTVHEGNASETQVVNSIPSGDAPNTEIQGDKTTIEGEEKRHEEKEESSSSTTTVDESEGPLKLFVGQIPRDWEESDCRQMFESETGFNVENISVLRDKKTGLSRGEYPLCVIPSLCSSF
jgi:hypothetical protein